MANRYWVGGTASWDGTAGTKWATTSGGAGGASVPTTADDVFFDNLSTGQAVIAAGNTGAKSINCTGFSGIISGSEPITVAGSITLSAGMTYSYIGAITITGTATITTAGKTFGVVNINATGGTVTLGDNFNAPARDFIMQAGTFDTAGFNMVAGQINSTTTGVRTYLWRASTITLSTGNAISITNSTNLTFTAGTSTFVLTSASASLTVPSGLTFHNVSFTDTTLGGNRNLAPDATYNNITIAAPTVDGAMRVQLTGSTTVNGTLSVTGSTFARRVHFLSNTVGTARTLTVATLSADHCDFEDITLAGAASPASPTGAGDCGNNTNITFPAPKTVYRVGTSTTWVGSSSWATSSGGTGSDANFPLVQDTAIIDNATTAAALTLVSFNRGALNTSARTSSFSFGITSTANFYGSFVFGSGVTIGGSSGQTYRGRSLSTLTTAGKTMSFGLTVQSVGSGGLQLGDALLSGVSLTLTSGTFDAVTFAVTLSSFSSNNSNTRTLSMGTQLWTLTSTGTVWNTNNVTGMTFDKGAADILLANNSTTARSVGLGSLTYNKLRIGGATSTSTTTIAGTTTTVIAALESTKTVAHTISFSTSAVTFDTWSVTGTAGNVVTLNSSVAGTRRTFNLTNITSGIDYLAVRDMEVLQADRFYVGANSTDNGNNVNVIFTAAPSGDVTVPVTGVSSTGEVGTVTVVTSGSDVDVPVVGVLATGAAGSVTATGSANVPVTGSSAAGAAGSVTVSIPAVVPVSGVFATGAVGSVTVAISSSVSVPVSGAFATGEVGDVATTGTAVVVLTGVSGAGQVGSVTVIPSIEVPVSGVSATGASGAVTITISVAVVPVGVVATGRVGAVVVWGPINPSPGSTWTETNPDAINSWTAVEPAPATSWTTVAA